MAEVIKFPMNEKKTLEASTEKPDDLAHSNVL